MQWVVQENIFNEYGYGRLIETLERFEIPFTVVKVIPFGGGIIPDVDFTGPTIVMGAYTMWKVAAEKQWKPGSFINDNFDFKVQVANWGELMFNHDSWVGCFDSVPWQSEDFFIRPIHDTKAFNGQVIDWENFCSWQASVLKVGETSYCTIEPNTMVQVAPCKHIYCEYRIWVVDGKIVTASLYKRGGRVYSDEEVDDEIIDFAKTCISRWVPARAFCLDVFVGPDGPRIGEVNNINAAGFYKADVQKLILALDSMEF
jgi:hypothetical protein